MEQTGLILEGGGMRGVYTAGVLDYLLDEGIHIPNVYGVSAGACHGVSYVSRQRGRAARTVMEYVGKREYASFYNLLTTGNYFGVQTIYHDIPEKHIPFDHDTYNQSGAAFFAVVYNCKTGQPEYLRVTDTRAQIAYVQASASLPMFSKMVPLHGGQYLDGGIADSIPLARSLTDGNERNLVILTQHRGFEKKPTSMLPLIRLRYAAYPQLAKSLARRHIRYNQQLELVYAEETAGRAVVIQPSTPVTIGKMEKDRQKLQALYEQGYADAKAQAAQLASFK